MLGSNPCGGRAPNSRCAGAATFNDNAGTAGGYLSGGAACSRRLPAAAAATKPAAAGAVALHPDLGRVWRGEDGGDEALRLTSGRRLEVRRCPCALHAPPASWLLLLVRVPTGPAPHAVGMSACLLPAARCPPSVVHAVRTTLELTCTRATTLELTCTRAMASRHLQRRRVHVGGRRCL